MNLQSSKLTCDIVNLIIHRAIKSMQWARMALLHGIVFHQPGVGEIDVTGENDVASHRRFLVSR